MSARGQETRQQAALEVPWSRRIFWVVAAAIPSLLLLGATRHLATDVASFPLLWVVPLAIYLVTFVVTFHGDPSRLVGGAGAALRLMVVPAIIATLGVLTHLWMAVAIPLVMLAVVGIVAHGRIYLSRPGPSRLTEFYLWVSFGGALGGLAGALVAPAVFPAIFEYPIAIWLSVFLIPVLARRQSRVIVSAGGLVFMIGLGGAVIADTPALAALSLGASGVAAYLLGTTLGRLGLLTGAMVVATIVSVDGSVIHQERTFFGVYRVVADEGKHLLISGTTVHGVQDFRGQPDQTPLGYYHPAGPFAEVLTEAATRRGFDEIGIVGLGAGGLVAYLGPGQHVTLYEIDPAVVTIATNPQLFTFLEGTEASIDVVVGDGRLMLESRRHPPFDLLIVDAFTSDAVPTHLLTREAVQLYLASIEPGGLVAIHISNRHLDLEPVVGRLAAELGLAARLNEFYPGPNDAGAAPVVLAVLAESEADLGELSRSSGWRPLRTEATLWTDSHSDLLSLIRWR
jgi:hypothetical protein